MYEAGHPKQCSVTAWRDRVGRWGAPMEGTHECLWPIHIDFWQKPSQFLIILKLK